MRDLRLAARRLAAAPVFTVFATLSLAVGVGLTTAVYSIVDAILWTESGVAEPDRTVVITASDTGGADVRWIVSRPDYDDFRAAQQSFDRIAATHVIYPAVALADATEIHQSEAVDGEYFRILGVAASLGRPILPDDDANRAAVVVLGHGLWRTRFASDPAVIGRTLRVSGRPFEIVGVAPREYEGLVSGLGRSTGLWIPLSSVDEGVPQPSRGSDGRAPRRLTMIGRLAPGRSLESARAEIGAFSAALDGSYPGPAEPRTGRAFARGWTPRTISDLRARLDRVVGRVGVLIVGLVALVLLVACTNLANLVLARGTLRHQEFAVRRALGASRWRLVREQCAECALLALLGGLGSSVVLRVLVTTLDTEIPMARNWVVSVQPEINATALAVSAIAVLLSLLVFGLEPALQLTRKGDVREELASMSGSVGVPKAKRQRRLLRWQVAISAGFFIIASMSVRYLAAEARHDSGVDLDRIAIGHLDFYLQRWDEPRARRAVNRILEEAQREPGLQGTALSSGLPFGTTISPRLTFARPDDPKPARGERDDATLIIATPGFFRAAGISILHGRGFDDRDDAGAPKVLVLGESTARKAFGTANAVGRQMLVKVTLRDGAADDRPDTLATVVGIAEDTDTTHFFMSRRGDTAYMPLGQAYSPWMTLVVRADDPDLAAGAIRRIVRRADPDLALSSSNVGTGRRVLAGPYEFLRAAGIAAVALGAITLLLAMAGLYGVQTHIVAHRTREIGVRMSCGATAAQIRAMVLKDGYRPVIQGLLLGLFIGFAGRGLVRAFLVGQVGLIDPWMFTLVPIPLLAAAFFACYLPARRASRVDPNVALRHL